MAYTAGYEHDLFVSYARKDDEHGWISTVVDKLGGYVSSRLGREGERLRFFRDTASLKANDNLEGLKAAAQRSAIFLAVGSPSYADSDWCRKERDAFLEVDHDGRRLFMIEMLPLKSGKEYDERIKERNRLPFYEIARLFSDAPTVLSPNADKCDTLLQQIASQVATVLEELQTAAQIGAGIRIDTWQNDTTSRKNGIVYLGQATDDLEDERLEVRNCLEQFGYLVLPPGDLPGGGVEFRKAVAQAFAGEAVNLYVQLLGQRPGRRPADLPEGYLRAQLDAAQAAKVATMLWRRPDIDLGTVADKDHLALLNGEHVVSSTLESFKQSVRSRLARKVEASPEDGVEERKTIFIDSENSDLGTAKMLQKELDKRDKTVRLSLFYGDTKEKRERLYECMQEFDFILLVYGKAPPDWVQSQLDLFVKLNPKIKRKRMKVIAALDGPPDDKPGDLGISMPELHWIDCRDGWKIEPVLELLEEVGA